MYKLYTVPWGIGIFKDSKVDLDNDIIANLIARMCVED